MNKKRINLYISIEAWQALRKLGYVAELPLSTVVERLILATVQEEKPKQ